MAIDYEYIAQQFVQWEDRKLYGYIPCYFTSEAAKRTGKKSVNFTGKNADPVDLVAIGSSGVTIGTGCDLGQQTREKLLEIGVPTHLVALFRPYLGKTKDKAIKALSEISLTVSEDECNELDTAVIGDYVDRIAANYNRNSTVKFANIPKQAQTVIAHLFYHLGSPTAKYPKTWEAFTSQNWQLAADKLRNGALWSGPYDWGRASEGRLLTEIPGVV